MPRKTGTSKKRSSSKRKLSPQEKLDIAERKAKLKRFKKETKAMASTGEFNSKLSSKDRGKIAKMRENRKTLQTALPYLSANVAAATTTQAKANTNAEYLNIISNGVTNTKPQDPNSVTETGSVLGG